MQPSLAPSLPRNDFFLRCITRQDIREWYAYLSLPDVFTHTSWNLTCESDLIPLLDQFESAMPDSAIRFAVIESATQNLVGSVGLHTISMQNKTAELAYDFAPDVWGKGLATACAKTLIDWSLHCAGFNRIQATVLPSNLASIRVLEKCGMQREGSLRKYRMVRGEPRDYLLYASIR